MDAHSPGSREGAKQRQKADETQGDGDDDE